MRIETRPDPDALLAQIQRASETAQQGKLRIYFGATAGVGKTWAMLSAAQREKAAGRQILVGVVETHGRSETAALLVGLEQIPLRQLAYRGRDLPEFDLDEALLRKPEIVLVDELAHTNAPGSRHAKRWQDVQELLAAGIDVWSALNVQHLESLNGTVGAITGIRVHETVPDRVLDEAEEVVLVDVTPDELTARLAAGKVYLPQQAERAAKNFFRKGNLIALREIALRRTAEHVEDDMRGWRIEQSGQVVLQAWNTSGAILACVGPSEGAAQTVRFAAQLAGQLNVRWHAAYVETPRLQRLPAAARDRVLAVLKLAEELGAETSVLTGSDLVKALADLAKRLNCATLVVGRTNQTKGWRRYWPQARVTSLLAKIAPSLNVLEVGLVTTSRRLAGSVQDSDQDRAQRAILAEDSTSELPPRWQGYAWASAYSVGITLLATPLSDVLELANIVMIFLLGVVGVAFRFGRGPAALSALLNVAAFDYFFVPPKQSFAVSDVQYLITFAVMLGVGLLVGQLTAGLRFSVQVSGSRERRAQSLFELSRELSGALEGSQVAALGASAAQRHFGGRALVLEMDASDKLVLPEASQTPTDFDPSVAEWSFRQGQPAGLATATLAAQPWHYLPLKAPMRVRGVLAIAPAHPRWLLIPEQAQQLETLARQIAIALERVHYVEVAQHAVVEIESERLRNALLAAISHDVRTPLTALIGLSESLATLPVDAHAKTAADIVAQSRQLHALVSNLLDMARLETGGGAVTLQRDWQSVEEVVGSAIRAAKPALGDWPVRTKLEANLPLVEFDAVLMERVLVNLLENARKYGAQPIEVSAVITNESLLITVCDDGAGLPPSLLGKEQLLFEKFTRGHQESATPGVGLGLAICKAIVNAHGGTIAASNAMGHGAMFTITLPRRPPPDIEA